VGWQIFFAGIDQSDTRVIHLRDGGSDLEFLAVGQRFDCDYSLRVKTFEKIQRNERFYDFGVARDGVTDRFRSSRLQVGSRFLSDRFERYECATERSLLIPQFPATSSTPATCKCVVKPSHREGGDSILRGHAIYSSFKDASFMTKRIVTCHARFESSLET
jgi:hypothetical protein